VCNANSHAQAQLAEEKSQTDADFAIIKTETERIHADSIELQRRLQEEEEGRVRAEEEGEELGKKLEEMEERLTTLRMHLQDEQASHSTSIPSLSGIPLDLRTLV